MNMNEDYAEVSIKGNSKKYTRNSRIIGLCLIVGGFLFVSIVGGMIFEKLFTVSIIMIGLYIFVCIPFGVYCMLKKTIEYDYLYVDTDIDVDAVLNQSKRKRKMTIKMDHVKRIAPEGSQALLGYEGKGNLKVKDFTSGDKDKLRYVFLVDKDGRDIEVILEPNQHMVQLLKMRHKDIFYAE